MRFLYSFASIIAIALFSGCQSCTTSVPIVGDSMSQWAGSDTSCSAATGQTRAGCGAEVYSDFGSDDCLGCGGGCGMDNCGGGGVPGACGVGFGRVGQAAFGCGGNSCNGSCGGTCRLAEMARARAGQNRLVAKFVNHATQKCAYGACSGPLGPQQGQVTFPYYTVRGPRDFLNPHPPSIGP